MNAAPQIGADIVQDDPLADRATCLEVWRRVFDAPPPSGCLSGSCERQLAMNNSARNTGAYQNKPCDACG
ncbi:hypothetical protein RC74_12535 [Falsihalocynthiibacter arcticus]|uniref:Uncharacterized protein n=1 Tax=Falsihalocynthiibacter arcticus TaxID=1579316 RepID=A0A126V268_9RHOB|nr:hypothetical protein RC74_12535 [Falsihalocynthiibacter arcticus]